MEWRLGQGVGRRQDPHTIEPIRLFSIKATHFDLLISLGGPQHKRSSGFASYRGRFYRDICCSLRCTKVLTVVS